MTIVIAVIVSVVVSLIVVMNATDPQLAPRKVNGSFFGNATQLLPDLVITRINDTSSGGVASGGCSGSNSTNNTYCQSSIYVTVYNMGTTQVSAGQSVVHLTVPDGNNTYVNLANISALAPGQSMEVSLGSGSHLSGLSYTAWVTADFYNQVNERNENNNVAWYSFAL